MRVLVSAFACDPDSRGSEPGAGWAWAEALARHNDVTVLTRPEHASKVAALGKATSGRLVAVGVPVGEAQDGRWSQLAAYLAWSHKARAAAEQMASQFDVFHHLTYTGTYLPTPFDRLPASRRLDGPVSVPLQTPPKLVPDLPERLLVAERWRVRAARMFALGRRPLRADFVLTQNRETAYRLMGSVRRVEVEPHVALERDLPRRASSPPGSDLVVASRLLAWKGVERAIRAVNADPNLTLTIYGDGPLRGYLDNLVSDLGLGRRIRFRGASPRPVVLQAIADAPALVALSIHEAGGWSVAEADAMGTPVVAFNYGGPSVILGGRAHALLSTSESPGAGDLIRAIDNVAGRVMFPRRRWGRERLPGLLHRVYGQLGITE